MEGSLGIFPSLISYLDLPWNYIGEVSIIKIYNEDELVKDVKVLMDVE